ncbi:MAG: S8 family serine peptidase, partial [candidate division Zixibacteria bacterium]|nr:S8 family serine peptidase [candidate division Zixibacteria bacterium]
MKKVLISTLFICLVIGISSYALEKPLVIPAKANKIGSTLEAKLYSLDYNEKIKVWLFFTDKGIFDNQSLNNRINSIRQKASPRIITRRINRTGNSDLFDFYDIPVNADYLDQLVNMGVEIVRQSRWLNAVSVRTDKYSISTLSNLPFVAEIREVRKYKRKPEKIEPAIKLEVPKTSKLNAVLPDSVINWYGNSYTQLNLTNIPLVHQFGYTGEGIRIALLDAGFELGLSVFDNLNLIDQYDFVDDDASAKDDGIENPSRENRHGTLVLSTIAGYIPDNLIGPAYGAEYLLARTEYDGSETIVEEDNWAAAAEWADSLGADIISTSVGYLDWYDYSDLDGNTAIITIAADLAVSRGITVFASAGNEGVSLFHYITPPADGDSVIAVGSVNSEGLISITSGAGPTFDGQIKPDIVSMGVLVYAVSNSGGYAYVGGTSFAAPLAAGAGALLLQAHPDWSPMELRQAMIESADRFENPENLYGYGLPDAFEGAELLYINPVDPIILSVGDSLDITFSITGLPDSTPVFSASNLPENAVFTDNEDR